MVVPLIRCPTCGTRVKFYLSSTDKHEGWVFYRCPIGVSGSCHLLILVDFSGSCDDDFWRVFVSSDLQDHFWHWELEYVAYLLDNQFLVGNEVVDALGAAEERREELMRARNRRYAVDLPSFEDGIHGRVAAQMSNRQAEALVGLANQILVMLKALLAAFIVLAVVVDVSLVKK